MLDCELIIYEFWGVGGIGIINLYFNYNSLFLEVNYCCNERDLFFINIDIYIVLIC